MFRDEEMGTVSQFLTPKELTEIDRIRNDNMVIGFVLLGLDGTEIESSGNFGDLAAPIFANILELVDRIGGEFGEIETSPMTFIESPDLVVIGAAMSSAKIVIFRRKQKTISGGLRSVR